MYPQVNRASLSLCKATTVSELHSTKRISRGRWGRVLGYVACYQEFVNRFDIDLDYVGRARSFPSLEIRRLGNL